MRRAVSRRDFLKLAGMGLGAMAFNPFERYPLFQPPYMQFPSGERLGRVSVFPYFYSTEIKAKPHQYAATVRIVPEDGVVEWLREVIGTDYFGGASKTWVETPEGYIYASHLQPIRNVPNTPIAAVPEGKAGFWAEVTVPYVDLVLENPPVRSPSFRYVTESGTNAAPVLQPGGLDRSGSHG